MKRVLIFSLAYYPHVGGAEIAIKEITDRIPDCEFHMVTLRFDAALPSEEKIGNVFVHRIGRGVHGVKVSDRALPLRLRIAKMLFPLTSYSKARSLHTRHEFHMIWAMMANQAGFGALIFNFFYPEVPYLLELQDGNSLAQVRKRRPITALIWPLYRAIYRRASAIKTISHFIERLAREIGYTGRLHVIPNGVDTAIFSAQISEDEKMELNVRFGKKMGDIFLFTASRLVLSRGVEDVIRALSELPTNVKFLIAGSGEDKEKLQRVAADAGVSERVIFAGHISHKELPTYLAVSNIFVRPSIIEGMGSAFIEAFAAGVPVIATPVGGIPDFLFDPDKNPDFEPTGIFCEVRNPKSVARAVRRYIEDPALVARVIKNAKELAAEKYDWALIAREQKKLFDSLTEGITH